MVLDELSDFDALSFDCYGTLIDWEDGIAAVLEPWAGAHGLDLDREALLAAYAGHEARVEEQEPRLLYPDVLARAFVEMGGELDVEVTPEDAAVLARSVPDWPAFPDSHDALASLAGRYRLVVLSNVDRDSFRGSEQRLGVRFDAVVTAEDVGTYKPAPRGFEVLLETVAGLGVRSGRLLHVAQSLYHDHVPAKTFGLPTVWIDRRHDRAGWGATPAPPDDVRPDWRFTSMADLAAACAAAATSA